MRLHICGERLAAHIGAALPFNGNPVVGQRDLALREGAKRVQRRIERRRIIARWRVSVDRRAIGHSEAGPRRGGLADDVAPQVLARQFAVERDQIFAQDNGENIRSARLWRLRRRRCARWRRRGDGHGGEGDFAQARLVAHGGKRIGRGAADGDVTARDGDFGGVDGEARRDARCQIGLDLRRQGRRGRIDQSRKDRQPDPPFPGLMHVRPAPLR